MPASPLVRLHLEFCGTNFVSEVCRVLAAVRELQVSRTSLSHRSTWGEKNVFSSVVYMRGCSEDPKLIGEWAVC